MYVLYIFVEFYYIYPTIAQYIVHLLDKYNKILYFSIYNVHLIPF
jgi:hypothetical protein